MSRPFRVNLDCPELREVLRNMDRYNTRTAVKIEQAIQTSTRNIATGVRRRIPVRTGLSKKSTRSRFDVRKVQGTVAVKRPTAHLVEFGHGGPKPAPEHPFMRPAYEDEKPNLIRNLAEATRP